MRPLRYIVYSDIHHDEKAARCLTLDDTLRVEQEIHQRAVEGNFDFVIFAGDRYLKREPKDEVKVKADQLLMIHQQVPQFHLVGNHDWVDNSRKWHTSESLRHKPDFMLMDQAKTYTYPTLPVKVHALPSGYHLDISEYDLSDPPALHLFVFHDVVHGSTSDDEGKHVFDTGIPVHEIDLANFHYVYAGDVHVPQRFAFKNTQGGYVGSVIQRTRTDSNRSRGWLEVEATQNAQGGWDFKSDFVGTRNFFTRYHCEVDENSNFAGLGITDTWVVDQAVEVHLVGKKADVDRIADDPQWDNLLEFVGARSLDVLREYKAEQSEEVVDMSSSQSTLDDFDLYLDSGFSDLGNLSKDRLVNLIEEARNG